MALPTRRRRRSNVRPLERRLRPSFIKGKPKPLQKQSEERAIQQTEMPHLSLNNLLS
jgi:hypothetical protein